MTSDITIKRLTKKKIKDVQYIIKKVFNKKLPLNLLDHKYNTKAYCKFEYLCCIAYFQNKPIGFYGATPLIFSKKDKSALIIQAHDTYIHKEFRGKGLSKKLALKSYDMMEEVGARAIFAYHSEVTYKSFKKHGWQNGYDLYRSHVFIKKLPIFKLYSKFPILNGLKKSRIKKVLKNYKTPHNFKNPTQSNDNFTVKYTREFIDFKTKFNTKIIEIHNCRVWIKFQSILTIGAFENLNHKNFDLVMNELKIIAHKIGTNEILIPFNSNANYASLLKENYDIKKSFHIGYFPFAEDFNFNDYQVNYIEFDTYL